MVNDPLDAQTSARLLRRAAAVLGSADRLARMLDVQGAELASWMAGKSFPPRAVFEQVLELILDGRSQAAAEPAPARRRVLVADSLAGAVQVAGMLGNEFVLVPVHTLAEALDLVQSSAVMTHGIDAIVCGQHFEGSQMLRFLECVKAYKPTAAIPFIGYRAQSTHLSEGALGAMREACEALGAVAYIDLATGAERAAVEFRDAVRAAVHLRQARERLRILAVDDNPDAAHTLAALLRIAGHDTYKAASGAEALAIGAELRPQAAILDIGLQGESGYALAQAIRATDWGRGALLIALTGRDAADERARSREAGFDHYFTKPATLEQLLEVLGDAGKR